MNGTKLSLNSEYDFDRGGNVFAVVEGANGSATLYDARSGKQRADLSPGTEDAGLCTAVVLGRDGTEVKTRSKKRARGKTQDTVKEEATYVLGVGYDSGAVATVSTGIDAVVRSAGAVHGAVRAMAISPDSSNLCCAAADKSVRLREVGTGKELQARAKVDRGAVTCMAYSPDGKSIAVGASKLIVMDASSLSAVHSLAGHTSQITSIAFASAETLFSGCEGDRHVLQWDLQSSAKDTASASFAASAPAVQLTTDGRALLAVLGTDATVSVFRIDLPGRPMTTIRSNVLRVVMPRPGWILVAHGKKFRPSFDAFEVESGVVELEQSSDHKELRKTPARAARTSGLLKAERRAVVLGAEADPDDAAGAAAPDKGGEESDDDDDDEGQTIEERLAEIGVGSDAQSKPETVAPPKEGADSVAAVLAQALRTRDQALLETGLESVRTQAEIRATVAKLPADAVAPMVQALADRVRSRPRRTAKLSLWLRAVVLEHAALLTGPSSGEVKKTLTALQHSIDERVRLHRKLAMLEGRLELLLTQGKRVAQSREGVSENAEPMLDIVVREDEDGEANDDAIDGTDQDGASEASLDGEGLDASDSEDAELLDLGPEEEDDAEMSSE